MKLRSYILWVKGYYKGDRCDTNHIRKLVDAKEKELQNISREDWKKKDKFVEGEWKEMSNEDILEMMNKSLNSDKSSSLSQNSDLSLRESKKPVSLFAWGSFVLLICGVLVLLVKKTKKPHQSPTGNN